MIRIRERIKRIFIPVTELLLYLLIILLLLLWMVVVQLVMNIVVENILEQQVRELNAVLERSTIAKVNKLD